MACKLLPIRNFDVKNSDTQSELSEDGTVTSGFNSNWGSREDLRDFIAKHGLKDSSDLNQDRFQIDRKKLEQMLSGDNNALIPADIFFAKIMEDTNTFITWPNRIKLGAKSKRYSYVRVAGKDQSGVDAAKERIMEILHTENNRVTLKMDVSYTDHSHIIGRGGLNIKRVMEETQCHVHFPDSNRSNATEKSNQVSICGDVDNVECARSRVRESMPLVFGFEPPIMDQTIDITNDLYIIKIQKQYNVQVMAKTRSKLHATIVLVKGAEWEVEQVKKATSLLIDYICRHLASQTFVQMSIQISPQQHAVVLGKNHNNLKAIMGYTKCEIIFSDAQDTNIPSLKRSHVTISGSINNVYTARQLLIGSLPLILIFDLLDEKDVLKIKSEQMSEIQNSCQVTITIRQKSKQSFKSCVIKGVERNAAKMYEARNLILGIEEEPTLADIPLSYQMPTITPPSPFLANDFLPTLRNINPNPMSPTLTQLFSPLLQFINSQQESAFLSKFQNCFVTSSSPQGLQQHEHPQQGHIGSGLQSNNASFCSDKSTNGSKSAGSSPQNFKEAEIGVENDEKIAYREIHTHPSSTLNHIPTNNGWSGCGFSQTSPANSLENAKNVEDIWKPSQPSLPSRRLNSSNILENTPNLFINVITSSNWSDLPSLLTTLNLERYIGTFVEHEMDLSTFSSLTEEDLLRIGVTAFGSRRKMMLAISELNKRANSFSAAPGAERSAASSIKSSQGNNNFSHVVLQ